MSRLTVLYTPIFLLLVHSTGAQLHQPLRFRMPPTSEIEKSGHSTAASYLNRYALPAVHRRLTSVERQELKWLFIQAAAYDMRKFHQTFIIHRACPLYQLLATEYPAVENLPMEATYLSDIAYVLMHNFTGLQTIHWKNELAQRQMNAGIPTHTPGFTFPRKAWIDRDYLSGREGPTVTDYMDTYPVERPDEMLAPMQRQRLVRFWMDALTLSMQKYGKDCNATSNSRLMTLTQYNFPAVRSIRSTAGFVSLKDIVKALK